MSYDKMTTDVFLREQLKLFSEKVCENTEEAESFLEEVCAVVCADKKELMEYLDEAFDISDLSEGEILSLEEVFSLPDGRFLVVEG